jgi:hypothetical protein
LPRESSAGVRVDTLGDCCSFRGFRNDHGRFRWLFGKELVARELQIKAEGGQSFRVIPDRPMWAGISWAVVVQVGVTGPATLRLVANQAVRDFEVEAPRIENNSVEKEASVEARRRSLPGQVRRTCPCCMTRCSTFAIARSLLRLVYRSLCYTTARSGVVSRYRTRGPRGFESLFSLGGVFKHAKWYFMSSCKNRYRIVFSYMARA